LIEKLKLNFLSDMTQLTNSPLIDKFNKFSINWSAAAHCVAHFTQWDVARLTVRLGDYNIRINTEVKHIERKVKRVVRHKGLNYLNFY
jgi:hypothetical protein